MIFKGTNPSIHKIFGAVLTEGIKGTLSVISSESSHKHGNA